MANRVGRPRLNATGGTSVQDARSPRQQILDAAAHLFTTQGYSATSTRNIAEEVGIRQASLYYHFPGKDDILLELLMQSVAPSYEFSRTIIRQHHSEDMPADEALYRLTSFDAKLLLDSGSNIGMLYLLPEIQNERFSQFHERRESLRMSYSCLAKDIVKDGDTPLAHTDAGFLGTMILEMVESAVIHRINGTDAANADHLIPLMCLSALNVPAERIDCLSGLTMERDDQTNRPQ